MSEPKFGTKLGEKKRMTKKNDESKKMEKLKIGGSRKLGPDLPTDHNLSKVAVS